MVLTCRFFLYREPYTLFWSLNSESVTKTQYSPRFWVLWPGVLLMIAVSFTELALQYRVFIYIYKAIGRAMADYTAKLMRKFGKSSPGLERRANAHQDVRIQLSTSWRGNPRHRLTFAIRRHRYWSRISALTISSCNGGCGSRCCAL